MNIKQAADDLIKFCVSVDMHPSYVIHKLTLSINRIKIAQRLWKIRHTIKWEISKPAGVE